MNQQPGAQRDGSKRLRLMSIPLTITIIGKLCGDLVGDHTYVSVNLLGGHGCA
jgi:hypothetical protein